MRRTVSVAFTPEAEPGDWVLVHVGFALATIDEDEAKATLDLLGEADRRGARGVKYVDEYRDGKAAKAIAAELRTLVEPGRT